MKKTLILLFACASLQTFAQTPYIPVNPHRVLIGAFPFQNFTYDARSAALAEAGVAISPDANSSWMNPAKLVFLDSTQNTKKGIGVHYTPYYRNLIEGMNFYGLNAFRAKGKSTYGTNIKYFDAGTVEMIAQKGVIPTLFKSKEYSITGFYGRQIGKKNSLAIGLKYTYSHLANQGIKAANALAGDIYYFHNGKIGREEKNTWRNYGVALTNIGGKVEYGDYKKRSFQPTLLKVGVAQNIQLSKKSRLMLTVDANKLLVPTPPIRDTNNQVLKGKEETQISGIGSLFQSWATAPDGLKETIREVYYCMGAELQIRQLLALRAGYYTQNKLKGDIHYFSIGAGLKLKGFGLDAAYLFPNLRNEVLKNTFRISLNYQRLNH